MEIILSILITGVLLNLLGLFSNQLPDDNSDGTLVIRLPKIYPIITPIVTILPAIYFLTLVDYSRIVEIFIALIVSLILFIVCLRLMAEGLLVNIHLTEEYLEKTTFLNKKIRIHFSDIQDVKFNLVTLELHVQGKLSRFKVHSHSIGYNTLISIIESRTKFSRQDMGLKL